MDPIATIEELEDRLSSVEETHRADMKKRRHVLLQELAYVEKLLGIKHTTAEIRTWWRQINRA